MKHLPASAGRIEAVWQNNIPSRVTSLQPMGKAQSAGWTKLNAPTTELLRSVHFLSESNGWVAGANGALLRTSNGGASWAAVSAGLNTGQNDFKTVRFVNANVGWLGSGNGMARTSDGGANWQIYEMPAGINGASDQVFLVLFGTGTRAQRTFSRGDHAGRNRCRSALCRSRARFNRRRSIQPAPATQPERTRRNRTRPDRRKRSRQCIAREYQVMKKSAIRKWLCCHFRITKQFSINPLLPPDEEACLCKTF